MITVIFEEAKEVNFLADKKYNILIADDSEMNRSILADILENEYEILEAENGVQALEIIETCQQSLSLVLLDIVMPELDGYGVLEAMNQKGYISDIPVIMISSESSASCVERTYELGVADFIGRPFDALIVRRRVDNTILLYAKQKRLIELAARQIYEKERQSRLMIEILSHVVEFRNGESGQHIRRVRFLTELLLRHLNQRSDVYHFSQQEIATISTASALHDIGKIAIPEKILNKPGRLTESEFAIMRTHAQIGAQILDDLTIRQKDPLIETAYAICRWHHERYDGNGYPDGLRGDQIPIAAQVVALADVYDALTTDRVYKMAITHETAVQMILDGKCGAFHPLLLSCLTEVSDTLKERLSEDSFADDPQKLRSVVEELLQREELTASGRTLRLLEQERMKYDFFAALNREIQFEYTVTPSMLILSPAGASQLGLPEVIKDPYHDQKLLSVLPIREMDSLATSLQAATPAQPEVSYDCKLRLESGERWFHIIFRTTWSEETMQCIGALGKAMDIHDSRMKTDDLERKASTDHLTGFLNHDSTKKQVNALMAEHPTGKFALAIFDLDDFKAANDTFGHQFGDKVLVQTAKRLRGSIRNNDIAARVGGDEFLLFLEYGSEPEPTIRRIFTSLCGKCGDFTVSVSLGVALTETVGYDYDALFRAADKALYTVKRGGRGGYCFYDHGMQDTFSVISPIDDVKESVCE